MEMHWAMRKLAGLLARDGFPVLRFDYFGTGDSAGGFEDASCARWQQDILVAAEELKELAQVKSIALAGCRLGATLAMGAVADGLQAGAVALWDPVISGSQYLLELQERERWEELESFCARPRYATHLLGYPLATVERQRIAQLDLAAVPPPSSTRTGVFFVRQRREFAQLARAWSAHRPACTFQHFPDDADPAKPGVRLADQIPRAITDWLARGAGA
jgi:pimeloyl-ACP methyl ester carboxylesterase